MSIVIVKKTVNNGKTIAKIRHNKENNYTLLIYNKTDSATLQNDDIITNKTYYTKRAAQNAMNRIIKSL